LHQFLQTKKLEKKKKTSQALFIFLKQAPKNIQYINIMLTIKPRPQTWTLY